MRKWPLRCNVSSDLSSEDSPSWTYISGSLKLLFIFIILLSRRCNTDSRFNHYWKCPPNCLKYPFLIPSTASSEKWMGFGLICLKPNHDLVSWLLSLPYKLSSEHEACDAKLIWSVIYSQKKNYRSKLSCRSFVAN